jgi:hypothetical protein
MSTGWFQTLMAKFKRPELVTAKCQKELNDALVGKTIENVIQVRHSDGWFIIHMRMTDNTAVHFLVPQLDACMRVQIDKADGTKLHLPEIKEEMP